MTHVPPGDLSPSLGPGSAPPPWQLRLGYELEEVYCAYAESPENSPFLFSDREALRMRDKGGWAVDRLHEINVEPPLIDLFEDALEGIPTQESAPEGDFIVAWLVGRNRMRRRLDYLMQATRVAVGRPCVRYYDCGIMLCRIHVCGAVTRAAATMPANYTEEVQRAGAVLEEFITHTYEYRPSDPGHLDLDRHLDTLAKYLKAWRAKGTNPDRGFFEQIDEVVRITGLAQVE
jgi:hypothetical protein